MKVLLVDDDVDHVDLMSYALRREGYAVSTALDGLQALERWQTEKPDIILLDGNLPKLDGAEVCRRIRHESKTPIIMVSARDEDKDIISALQYGADDYVTKPFNAKQLTARMQAVLRRCQPDPFRQPASEVRAGDIVLDLHSHSVTVAGRLADLTPLEFKILYVLAMNEGRVVPYSRLIEHAWGFFNEQSSTLLKTHICHIRRKLGIDTGRTSRLKAVFGVGYSLQKQAAPAVAA
ncbi:MAG TPA: response regulator transcription factor [Chloroflexota bacterium]|nr:response regulator transcription factor [Chloroflexota bacterium]